MSSQATRHGGCSAEGSLLRGRARGRRNRGPARRARRAAGGALVAVVALVLPAASRATATPPAAAALTGYVAAVEPIRDGVNRLLDGADPLLARWRDHRLTGAAASAAMARLEQQFAAFTAAVNALHPADAILATLHAPYAHTYVQEDAYLRALVAALPSGDFSALPRTAEQQRRVIVAWRDRLESLARAAHVKLPSDVQHAGRGDIAPWPTGS